MIEYHRINRTVKQYIQKIKIVEYKEKIIKTYYVSKKKPPEYQDLVIKLSRDKFPAPKQRSKGRDSHSSSVNFRHL
jgi:hypothetical protein